MKFEICQGLLWYTDEDGKVYCIPLLPETIAAIEVDEDVPLEQILADLGYGQSASGAWEKATRSPSQIAETPADTEPKPPEAQP